MRQPCSVQLKEHPVPRSPGTKVGASESINLLVFVWYPAVISLLFISAHDYQYEKCMYILTIDPDIF